MKGVKPVRGQMSDSFRAAFFIILSGGFQDAYTYTCRGKVFANAQTGNIVLLSTALFQREWQTMLKYLIPVLAFLIAFTLQQKPFYTLYFGYQYHILLYYQGEIKI